MSVDQWIKRYLADEEPKSKSLIVSVFGDSIAPYASGIWLGDLIGLFEPFGVSERLVRTSSFRLIDEDWLEARRDGRRSFYSLTESGKRRIEIASERIYTPPIAQWDGAWTLLLLPKNGDPAPDRVELRRELEWEGFASPTPGVMMHPTANHEVLRQLIASLDLSDRVVVLRAQAAAEFSGETINALITRCWDLSDVSARYTVFIERFQPLLAELEGTTLPPQQAFLVQSLLIHSFRRATLHDPRLPTSMLPSDWPGLSAYNLCRQIYQLTYLSAYTHLSSACDLGAETQPPLKADSRVRQRFGGLG